MKRKLLATLLTLCMMVSAVGCSSKTESSSTSEPAEATQEAEAESTEEADAPEAAEAEWPKSAVQLVCAYAAGGGTDICCRTLAQSLAAHGNFGVVNNTDGGGVVGWEQVRTSDPATCDQLIFALNSMFLSYLSGVSDIDPLNDIQPVFAMESADAYFVVVNKDAPYNTLEEMIEYGKANPGTLTLGSGAPGSTMTILTSQFISSTGLDCRLAATSGSDADAVAMVMGGNLDIYLTNQNTTITYLEANEVKVLAAIHPVSEKAAEIIRDIPSLDELGYENVKMGTTFIVWAPVGADQAVYEKINALFTEAYEDPATQEAFAQRGNDYVPYGTLEETVTKLTESYAACESSWNDYMASQGN